MTLAELIAERRARFEAFETDTRDNAVHDISEASLDRFVGHRFELLGGSKH